jgi:hypothetical protein
VGSHEADENDAGVVVDFHDQTIGVTLDVEDDAVVREDVSGGIVLLDFIGAVPTRVGGFFEPRFESLLGIGVFVPEFPQGFYSDDSHATLLRLLMGIKLKVPFLGTFLFIGRFSFHAQGGFAFSWHSVVMNALTERRMGSEGESWGNHLRLPTYRGRQKIAATFGKNLWQVA